MSFDQNDPFAKPADQGQPQQPTPPSQPPAYGAGQPGAAQQGGMPMAPQYQAGGPGYGQPGPGQPGQPYGAPSSTPGKGLSIAGLICSIIPCVSPVGLILSIVAFVKSRKTGQNNGIALAGIIVGALVFIITIIGTVIFFATANEIYETCRDGSGTYIIDGITYTCP